MKNIAFARYAWECSGPKLLQQRLVDNQELAALPKTHPVVRMVDWWKTRERRRF